jgi:hypothetical protein
MPRQRLIVLLVRVSVIGTCFAHGHRDLSMLKPFWYKFIGIRRQ